MSGGLAEGDVEVAVAATPEPEIEDEPAPTPASHREDFESDDPEPPKERRRFEFEAVEWETPEITESQHEEDVEMGDTRIMEPIPAEDEIRITANNWLDEVEDGASTIEWPAGRIREEHEPIDTPTVRHLFPVPEDADWEVRELKYDHYRDAG